MKSKINYLPLLNSKTISKVQEGSVLVTSDCVYEIKYYVVVKITKNFIKFRQIGYEYTEGEYTRPVINDDEPIIYSKKIKDYCMEVDKYDVTCLHIYDGESEIYNSYREAQRER